MRSNNDWWDYLEHGALYHHGVKGMKWGVRKDRSSPSSRAKKIFEEARKREPRITRDVTNSITKSGGSIYGLEHRLKTKESITRKTSLDKEIKDAIRYTAILSEKDFVKGYNSIKTSLAKKGYTESRCKNYFEDYRQGKVNHKSVQCNYQTKDGYTFEIQFQTKLSQNAKDRKVPLYEEARNPKTTAKRQKELIAQMRKLAEEVKDPPGINKIKAH